MSEITVRFDLHFSKRVILGAMAAAMMLASASELSSESVTLTTYYPAPSGVYTQMVTTDNTWLARDGGAVAVGNVPVGVAKMSVLNAGAGVGLYVGNGAAYGQSYIEQDGPAGTHIWTAESGTAVFYVAAGGRTYIAGNLGVGVGALTGNKKINLTGNIHITSTGCSLVDGACNGGLWPNDNACGGAQYATYTPGVYTEGMSPLDRPRLADVYVWSATQVAPPADVGVGWRKLDSLVLMCAKNYYWCCAR